ncbi:MAG TPA: hypothetical protein DCL76_03745 [Chloroflexi bacterium]|nr:hypothetical protein [Chloroflexota bacterium]HCU98552.1 hypothetical protein [Chloroflexota bacterium]|tara:strand:- start:4078 stop:5127 length:1050 start_codon:yes stop_codon:yes gene_type:complete
MSIAFICVVIIAICIYVLGILTDKYFVPSLDVISSKLRLSSDVSGATLMAIGSSAPELAIALIALIRPGGHTDVGIGTIVGSALFNVLVITGASAIARPLVVKWTIITRDVFVYVLSVILLIWAIGDGKITGGEAITLILVYVIYVIGLIVMSRARDADDHADELVDVEDLLGIEDNSEKINIVDWALGKILGDPKSKFVNTFILSVVMISFISWCLVESGIALADVIGVPPVVVALTILAPGTSVPDMISSIVVAKQGRGAMSVANAVGSNIFDILIGLGLPWLLMLFAGVGFITIGIAGISQSTWLLLGSVFVLYLFILSKGRLSRFEGYILVLLYVGYVLWMYFGW